MVRVILTVFHNISTLPCIYIHCKHNIPPPHWRREKGECKCVCAPPPLLDSGICSNFTICSYFVVIIKNTQFFQNFLSSLRSPTLINILPNFANFKL